MSIPFSIQQQGVSAQHNAGFSASSSGVGSVGSLFGNAAEVVESPLSLLADAAEELTFAADTTDDFELDERKEREAIEEATEKRLKKYQEMMRAGGKAGEINQLKDAIRARQGKEHALRQARQHFPDPSDAWAALKEIRDALARDASAEIVRGVDEAIAELEAAQGPAIRSGLCGALNAAGFDTLGGPSELGALYRGVVCDFTDINALYAHIQEQYGNNFDAAVDFLYKALASDMAADTPSMEKAHLEHVNAGLGELRSLQSARSLCAKLLERWARVHGVRHCPLDDMALLGKVVDLRRERFIAGSRIARLADEAGAPDIERKVLFLQELLNTTRSFAPSLFDGNEGRMKVLDAVQNAVDAAIAEEDAWLASQE